MVVLSKYHRRAAAVARLCRRLATEIRRPALAEYKGMSISIGTNETVSFYLSGGNLYEAQLDVDRDNSIVWVRNEILAKDLPGKIDEFFRSAVALRGRKASFRHWCSLTCSREHDGNRSR